MRKVGCMLQTATTRELYELANTDLCGLSGDLMGGQRHLTTNGEDREIYSGVKRSKGYMQWQFGCTTRHLKPRWEMNTKMVLMRINTKQGNITLIQVYAHTVTTQHLDPACLAP
jgi:hypothetical protein